MAEITKHFKDPVAERIGPDGLVRSIDKAIPPMTREEWPGQRKFLNHRRNMLAYLKNPRALMAAGYSAHEALRISNLPVNAFLDLFERRSHSGSFE